MATPESGANDSLSEQVAAKAIVPEVAPSPGSVTNNLQKAALCSLIALFGLSTSAAVGYIHGRNSEQQKQKADARNRTHAEKGLFRTQTVKEDLPLIEQLTRHSQKYHDSLNEPVSAAYPVNTDSYKQHVLQPIPNSTWTFALSKLHLRSLSAGTTLNPSEADRVITACLQARKYVDDAVLQKMTYKIAKSVALENGRPLNEWRMHQ